MRAHSREFSRRTSPPRDGRKGAQCPKTTNPQRKSGANSHAKLSKRKTWKRHWNWFSKLYFSENRKGTKRKLARPSPSHDMILLFVARMNAEDYVFRVFVPLKDAGAILAALVRTFVRDRSQNGGLLTGCELSVDERHYVDQGKNGIGLPRCRSRVLIACGTRKR